MGVRGTLQITTGVTQRLGLYTGRRRGLWSGEKNTRTEMRSSLCCVSSTAPSAEICLSFCLQSRPLSLFTYLPMRKGKPMVKVWLHFIQISVVRYGPICFIVLVAQAIRLVNFFRLLRKCLKAFTDLNWLHYRVHYKCRSDSFLISQR